jgi:hypothetical protein
MGQERVMLPDGVLSDSPVPAPFYGARSLPVTKTVDYEDGGIAIADASEGLLYQRWRARVFNSGEINSKVVLDATFVPETDWLVVPYIDEFSFTFDTNMRPVVAYVVGGVSFLHWYDGVAGDFVTTNLGADVVTPRVTLDDKRFLGSVGYSRSSVILAYIKDGDLYYRDQSERFLNEHLLKEAVNPLIKIGFNRQLRLQFMVQA